MRLDLKISDELGFPSEGTARVRRLRVHTQTRECALNTSSHLSETGKEQHLSLRNEKQKM